MTYRVIVPPEIERIVVRLHPVLKTKVRAAFDLLAEDPYQGKVLKENLAGLRSFRVAGYRIVYRIYHKALQVYIVALGHRGDVYQSLSP
ncbi:MAG: type II toxin-antitoxin system RelE/ParE family toxin [Deltaproteobacteria bacterium]|nr:type II toxin-antitoxin system RelE/ParE family toxin [Deltaproteobacteria bacterium]